jgi:ferric-dicitrate binding protein FerR (iron transport regulator)
MGYAGEDPTQLSDEAPTRALTSSEPVTDRTRRMPPTVDEPATPAAPQPVPRRPAPAAAAPRPGPPARRRSGLGTMARVLGVLILIAVLAAIIVAVVLLVTDAGQQTDIGELLRDSVDEQIQSLEDFIRENTQ